MIVRFARVFGVALVLLIMARVFPNAVLFVDWWDAILLAFVLQVTSGLLLGLSNLITSRVGFLSAGFRALLSVAIRFAVPAVTFPHAGLLVPGAYPLADWPGYLLGGLAVAVPLFLLISTYFTRPQLAAVCAVELADETILAYGGWGHRVGLGDLTTNRDRMLLGARPRLFPAVGLVNAVCQLAVGDRVLLAAGGDDWAIRLWDPTSGRRIRTLSGHRGAVYALCQVQAGPATLLASGGDDGVIRLWDPGSGATVAALRGHRGFLRGMCQVSVDGTNLLATVGQDAVVRLWDIRAGRLVRTLAGATRPLQAVCGLEVGGRELIAAAGQDSLVRIWDPATGELLHTLAGPPMPVYDLCQVPDGDRTLLASAGDGIGVRLWDPVSGELVGVLGDDKTGFFTGSGWFRALCTARVDDGVMLAAVGYEKGVESWDVNSDLESSS